MGISYVYMQEEWSEGMVVWLSILGCYVAGKVGRIFTT
jgi:hypothetical protein